MRRWRAGERRAADRHSAGDQGSVLHRGRAHHGRQPDPGAVRAALREHGHRQPAARRRGVPRQGEHGRVRHGLVQHDLGLRRRWRTRGSAGRTTTPCWCRAARPAARRRRWRRGWRWARRAPTPAARSASRRRSAASSASSRPMGGARAGAWWRSPRRWTRPGRSRARCEDCAILLGSMAGHDPKDSTSADRAGAGLRGRLPARREGAAHRRAARIPRWTACRRRSRRCGSRASPGCATRAPRSSTCRCRTRNTAWRPTTSWRRPRRRPTWRAMTACASALRVDGEDLTRPVRAHPRRGVRRRGAAAHPDRHLRAVGRLLRRLLPAGAEGAGADPARLHRGVPARWMRC